MESRRLVVACAVLLLFGAQALLATTPQSNAMPLRCTNMMTYAGDPRSNAEINSIGDRTGVCPAPLTGAGKAMPLRCTNMINYARDPRPNAEINSIGDRTGECPPPMH